jgi:hypothetical protein
LIHPDSELRYVNAAIGYGVFATRLIPKGTITWVPDPLDQMLSPARYAALTGIVHAAAYKYSYLNGRGEHVLCWDHARFVNHSCAATCLSAGFDFEIAVRDILPGEELTDDYGTLNLEESFPCLCGAPNCRGSVEPDDPERLAAAWDALTSAAFPLILLVEQPLWELVSEKEEIAKVLSGALELPSVLNNYLARTARSTAARVGSGGRRAPFLTEIQNI